jgi:hypothetical protein
VRKPVPLQGERGQSQRTGTQYPNGVLASRIGGQAKDGGEPSPFANAMVVTTNEQLLAGKDEGPLKTTPPPPHDFLSSGDSFSQFAVFVLRVGLVREFTWQNDIPSELI